MDKYEFNIKVEQIKKLVGKNEYETAMKIADTIDWRRVRNANLLSLVAEIYEKNDEFQDAKDILLMAFERAPIGKRLLFKLAELALRESNVEEAEAYYNEFCDLAPEDSRQHLLNYLIMREKQAPADQLIQALERYTTEELDEKWLYELAVLYHEAGDSIRCVGICDKIMLMFGLGKYVDQAMELKTLYAPLTKYQMDLVENRGKYEQKLRAVEQNLNVPDEDRIKQKAGRPVLRVVEPPMEPPMEPELTVNMGNPDPQELVMAVKQAEVEEYLAEEMSKISIADYTEQEAPNEKTRVLGDLKSIKRPRQKEQVPLPHSQLLLICALTPERGLKFAVETLKTMQDTVGVRKPVAKITGSKLNQKGLLASAAILKDKDIIIEEAGDLSSDTIEEMLEFVEQLSGTARILLIDEPDRIQGLCESYPYLLRLFLVKDAESEVQLQRQPQLSDAPRESMDSQLQKSSRPQPQSENDTESRMQLRPVMESVTQGQLHPVMESVTQGQFYPVMESVTQGQLHPEMESVTQGQLYPEMESVTQGQLRQEMEAEIQGQLYTGVESATLRHQPETGPEIGVQSPPEINTENRTLFQPEMGPRPQLHQEAESQNQLQQPYTDFKNRMQLQSESEPEERSLYLSAQHIDTQPQNRRDSEGQQNQHLQPEAAAQIQPGSEVLTQLPEHAQELPPEKSRPHDDRPVRHIKPEREDYQMPYQKAPSVDLSEPEYYDDEDVMDIDRFAQYACKYAAEIDCSITGKSMLALYERIEIMEEEGIPLTVSSAEELIEEAADRAEKRSIGKLITGVFSSKYDKDGLLILKEEHFI